MTLKEVPDEELDRIAALGFDWVWLLSVWQTGEASRAVSRGHPGWLKEFREILPDLTEATSADRASRSPATRRRKHSAAPPLSPISDSGLRSAA